MRHAIAVIAALISVAVASASAQVAPSAQQDSNRSLHGVERAAAAATAQDIFQRLDNLNPQGIIELRMQIRGAEESAIGFVSQPGFAVFLLSREDATEDDLSSATFSTRTSDTQERWRAARFVGHSERCGCFLVQLNDSAVPQAIVARADPFRGQVVWARGPLRSTLVGLVSNESGLFIELDMANRGPHYGPVYDLDGALIGIITHKISRADSLLADVYFAVPSALMATEAASLHARRR